METQSIEIRTARASDRSGIQTLILAAARRLTIGDYSGAAVESALRSGAWGLDAQLIDDGVYYLAMVGDRLAACGGWSYRASFGNHHPVEAGRPTGGHGGLLDPEKDAARIRGFYTHPDFAGRGVGGLLLSCCETAAQISGFRSFELAATPAGERLYRKNGYAGRHVIDYDVGRGLTMRALLMRKDAPRRTEIEQHRTRKDMPGRPASPGALIGCLRTAQPAVR